MKSYGSTTKTEDTKIKQVAVKPTVTKEEITETATPKPKPEKKKKAVKKRDAVKKVRFRQTALLVALSLSVVIFIILAVMNMGNVFSSDGIKATMIDQKEIMVEDETKSVYVSKSVIVPVYDYQYDGKEYTVAGNGDVTFKSSEDALSHYGKEFTIYVNKDNPGEITESVKAKASGVIFMVLAVLSFVALIFFVRLFKGYNAEAKDKSNKKSEDNQKRTVFEMN